MGKPDRYLFVSDRVEKRLFRPYKPTTKAQRWSSQSRKIIPSISNPVESQFVTRYSKFFAPPFEWLSLTVDRNPAGAYSVFNLFRFCCPPAIFFKISLRAINAINRSPLRLLTHVFKKHTIVIPLRTNSYPLRNIVFKRWSGFRSTSASHRFPSHVRLGLLALNCVAMFSNFIGVVFQ